MNAMRMAGFCVAAGLCVMLLRRLQPGFGMAAALAAGILLLGLLTPLLTDIIAGLMEAAHSGGVKDDYMLALMKIAGVSLMMDFAAQSCRDAGEEGIALKAELAGRVMLLAIALPSMQTLLEQILALAP